LRNIIQLFRKIIILDEPTVGLDSEAKAFLIHLLSNIQNKTLIIITHDKDILKIANRIIFMDNGKIIQDN
jgi:ABC-type transport system involved in cytochrome bd biosynthesis fused ATPase/permease subunit